MGSHVTVTQLTSHQHEGLRRSPASSPSPPPTPCSSSRTGPRLPMSLSTEWPDRPPCRRRIQEEEDLETAADAAYGAAPVGRVKIQTYRGPSKGEGYEVFAPWGYYNTQPLDAGKHH